MEGSSGYAQGAERKILVNGMRVQVIKNARPEQKPPLKNQLRGIGMWKRETKRIE
jgi:hypothetical protein